MFDLCLTWCEFLDVELFILFMYTIFLQITEGASIHKSNLKQTQEIKLLPLQFHKEFE